MTYYKSGSGPGVLLLHELPGMTPQFLELAERLSQSGFTVYAPLLFGEKGRRLTKREELGVCRRADINCVSRNTASPVVTDLASLVNRIHKETGTGVGAIGMCLTGHLPLVLAANPVVRVAVLSQPAIPIPLPLPGYAEALGISEADIAAAKRNNGLHIIAQRFAGDCVSPPERLEALERTFKGQIEVHTLADPHKGAHAILTDSMDYTSGTETRAAFDRIVNSFRANLAVR